MISKKLSFNFTGAEKLCMNNSQAWLGVAEIKTDQISREQLAPNLCF